MIVNDAKSVEVPGSFDFLRFFGGDFGSRSLDRADAGAIASV